MLPDNPAVAPHAYSLSRTPGVRSRASVVRVRPIRQAAAGPVALDHQQPEIEIAVFVEVAKLSDEVVRSGVEDDDAPDLPGSQIRGRIALQPGEPVPGILFPLGVGHGLECLFEKACRPLVHVVGRKSPHCREVVAEPADHFAPRLPVAGQLHLDDDRLPVAVDENDIGEPVLKRELPAYRDERGIVPVNEEHRVPDEDLLQFVLVPEGFRLLGQFASFTYSYCGYRISP